MTIRPAREEDLPAIGRVHVDAWRTTYAGIVPDAFLAGLSYEKQAERQRRYLAQPSTILLVAEEPGIGVVGFLTAGPERSGDLRYPAELYAIYLLKEYRRRGIGSSLVYDWAGIIRNSGTNSALVWALTGNQPAIDFYRCLGARPLRESTINIGGVAYPEIALAWDGLSWAWSID